MTDKIASRRRESVANNSHAAARSASGPARNDARGDGDFDNAFERWSFGLAQEGLADELRASNALLRGALALRQMQIDAARRTQAAHEQASRQLASARSLAELGSTGLQLMQTDAEGAVRYWSDMAGIGARTALESWSEALGAVARLHGLAQSAGQQLLGAAATAQPQVLAAQLDHATTPVMASPFVWPVQEAMREAMTLGARNWNEWLGSTLASATAREAGTAAATTKH